MDADGNVTQIANGVALESQSYGYNDVLHRLTSWTLPSQPTESYAYNSSSGNLMTKGATTLQYNNASHPHAVSNAGSNTYAYDANGNQIARVIGADTFTLKYDAENRLVKVKKNNIVIAAYTYDADGRQARSVVNSVTTTFVGAHYQVEGGLTVKYYTSTSLSAGLAGGQRIATLAPGASAGVRTPNNNVTYLLTDHLGSTSLTTNSTGVVTSELRYSPCPYRVLREGETRFTSGTSPSNYRYTGQRQDSYSKRGLILYWSVVSLTKWHRRIQSAPE